MKRLNVRASIVVITLTAFGGVPVNVQTPAADLTPAIVAAVQRRPPSVRRELAALYDPVGSRPLWVDGGRSEVHRRAESGRVLGWGRVTEP